MYCISYALFLPFLRVVLSLRLYRSPPTVFDRLSSHPSPTDPTPKELFKDMVSGSLSPSVQVLRFGLKLRWGGNKKTHLPAFFLAGLYRHVQWLIRRKA